jgi:hypothetical protein
MASASTMKTTSVIASMTAMFATANSAAEASVLTTESISTPVGIPVFSTERSMLTTVEISVPETMIKVAATKTPAPIGIIAVIIVIRIPIGIRIPVIVIIVTGVARAPVKTKGRQQQDYEESFCAQTFSLLFDSILLNINDNLITK